MEKRSSTSSTAGHRNQRVDSALGRLLPVRIPELSNKVSRRHDPRPIEILAKREQVLVAGNNHVHVFPDCDGHEVIIVLVAYDSWKRSRLLRQNRCHISQKVGELVPSQFRNAGYQLRLPPLILKFRELLGRDHQLQASPPDKLDWPNNRSATAGRRKQETDVEDRIDQNRERH